MKTTEGQRRAIAKYQAKLDEIKVRVPKGKREVYKAHAESKGKSLNGLIVELLDNDMNRQSQPGDILEYAEEEQPCN